MKKTIRYRSLDFIVFVVLVFISMALFYELHRLYQVDRQIPYRSHWQFVDQIRTIEDKKSGRLVRRNTEQKIELLTQTIEQFAKLAAIIPENPYFWNELGHLRWRLYCLLPEKNLSMLQTAAKDLTTAKQTVSGWGANYFHLARIYQLQSEFYRQQNNEKRYHNMQQQTNCAMLKAQVLASHNLNFAPAMAAYWLKQYQKKREEKYQTLLFERFYYLNYVRFDKYGKRSLEIWLYIQPRTSPWGKILPQQEHYALEAARFYLQYRNYVLLDQLLAKVTSVRLLPYKHLIEANSWLSRQDLAKALSFYRNVIFLSVGRQKKQLLLEICKTLTKFNHFDEAMKLLSESNFDLLDTRLPLLEYAVSLGLNVLPILEDTQKQFISHHKLHFLLSKAYWQNKKVSLAVHHGQKAVESDYSSGVYARHFFAMLFSMGMEEKVAFHLQRYGAYLPRPELFYIRLAEQYLAKDELHKALQWARKAYKLDPENHIIRYRLQQTYRKLAQKKENS